MTTESLREGTHRSTSITKDATGAAFTAPTTGARSSRATRTREQSAARATPVAAASAKPADIRASESPTESQNSPVRAS